MRRFIILILFLLVAWCSLFLFFLGTIQGFHKVEDQIVKGADTIVVLTGGAHRIEKALELFSQADAQKILISGVDEKVTLEDIIEQIQSKEILENIKAESIVLGYVAKDTVSNAMEVKIFMTFNGYKSFVLVTSGYHLPRSMMVFSKMMPDYQIIPFPSDDVARVDKIMLVNEFHKYITLALLHKIGGLEKVYRAGVATVGSAIQSLIR